MGFRFKNVLVTGGTGFVGQWMAKTIPAYMEGVFMSQYQYASQENRCLRGDYWDYIVHLAPITPRNVLRYAEKRDAKVLYCSSGAVYDLDTPYAQDKREWERECEEADASVVIARLFTFSGAGLKPIYALPAFIEAAKHNQPLDVWGDGSSMRSYLYGEDLGRWMWKILLDGVGIYDVGSIVPWSIWQVAQAVKQQTDARIVMTHAGHPRYDYLPDTTRTRELGCVETVGLNEAIERMLHG